LAHISVSKLNEQVRNALRNRFPRAVWLVGQLSGWDRNAHKEHIFFELTERDAEGAQDIARVTAVLFGGMRGRIARRLDGAGGDLRLQDGVQVRLRVKVDLYARSGSYQVVVEDIDPAYTLGTLALNRERVFKELEARGLVARNRSLPEPHLPLRVALVTSWGSDAANDVLAELRRSGYAFAIDLYDAYMQGPQLRSSVVAALERIAEEAGAYDICLLCRGGGSRTDLAWFDDLEVALRVAQLPLPVVVGIGHQRDVGVLDLIARSEKTPTAAAASLVARISGEEALLEERWERAVRLAEAGLRSVRLDLTHQVARFRRAAVAATRLARETLESRPERLQRAGRHTLALARGRLSEVSATTVFLARRAVQEEVRAIDGRVSRLRRVALSLCAGEASLLESRRREISAQDPARLLARGFAIVRGAADGKVLTRVEQARRAAVLQIEVLNGLIDARVIGIDARAGADAAPETEEKDNG
jgi:exodeoxyribonuclease VII large subunit